MDINQLKKEINSNIGKIKTLLGQNPEDLNKDLLEIQNQLRKALNRKNWCRSVDILLITDRLRTMANRLENLNILVALGIISESPLGDFVKFSIPLKKIQGKHMQIKDKK